MVNGARSEPEGTLGTLKTLSSPHAEPHGHGQSLCDGDLWDALKQLDPNGLSEKSRPVAFCFLFFCLLLGLVGSSWLFRRVS